MRFNYEYRTSDNAPHKGVIDASDRDSAYAALRAQGIKASRVDEAPGFWNKLLGKGKRWLAIAVLSIFSLAVILAYRDLSRAFERETRETTILSAPFAEKTRRQVIGDSAVIEKGIRTGWAEVFSGEGERFLASFAIPGVPAGLKNTSEAEILSALGRTIAPEETDSLEARQIKAMVEGMKDELREYLSAGGTIVQYGEAIVARQEEELGYYNRAKAELEAAAKDLPEDEVDELWEKRNASLRRMGIRLLPLPD